MSFLHRLTHRSDGLHRFSWACQRSLSRGWMARQILLPFDSLQNWHGRLLPVDYFWKVLLLLILPPRFPCARKSCMSPCRTFLKNPIPVCRLVLPTSWGRREGESCWVLQGPFSWKFLIQVKSEGYYSVPLVAQKISWAGDLEVFSLCVSWRVSACWVSWGGESNGVNLTWLVWDAHWLYSQLDLLRCRILLDLPRIT